MLEKSAKKYSKVSLKRLFRRMRGFLSIFVSSLFDRLNSSLSKIDSFAFCNSLQHFSSFSILAKVATFLTKSSSLIGSKDAPVVPKFAPGVKRIFGKC